MKYTIFNWAGEGEILTDDEFAAPISRSNWIFIEIVGFR